MPTPSVTRLARSATTLAVVSSALGTSITSARPTAGTNTASVKPHSWNQFISRRPLTEDGDREGYEPDGGKEQERVALESTRLQGSEQATGLVRLPREPVDRAVDHVLVDEAVRHPTERGRAHARAPFTTPSMTFMFNQYDARAIGPLMPATITPVYRWSR